MAPEQSVCPGPGPGRDWQNHGQKGKVISHYSGLKIENAITMIFIHVHLHQIRVKNLC